MAEAPRFSERPHGTRSRYVQGCRCEPCRSANVRAYHARQAEMRQAVAELAGGAARTASHCVGVEGQPCPGARKLYKNSLGNLCAECRARLVWNGLVPADRAREHLRELSRLGVGKRAVAAATDIGASLLQQIKSGARRQIRAKTERLILEVDLEAASDRALVDARPVWRQIRRLMRMHGFTRAEISRRIGQDGKRLQLGKRRVTARNAHKIARLLADAEGAFLEKPPTQHPLYDLIAWLSDQVERQRAQR